MRKLMFGVLALWLAAGIVVAAKWELLLDRVMVRQIDRNLGRVDTTLLQDGQLHVFLCGTAAALPDRDRAGPCTAVIANGEFLLFDIGPAAWRNVDLLDLPISQLSGVFLTHFHSDHIGGLGEAIQQSWIAGRAQPLEVHGPTGVQRVVDGFALAYQADTGYRVAHHDDKFMPALAQPALSRPFVLPAEDERITVFERNDVKVSAFRVDHAPIDQAVGYRIDYRGRSVVISGDTTKTDNTILHARGADLLIHEALASRLTNRVAARAAENGNTRLAKLAVDVHDYHATPVEAAEVAQAAGVKQLVISHVFPPLPNAMARRMFMQGVGDAFEGESVLGEDGMRFDLSP